MAKSSINFKPIKANSQHHNERLGENLAYVHSHLTVNNEHWKSDEIDAKLSKIKAYCKKVSGRKLQKNAVPIREAVVNLNAGHSMENLKELAQALEVKFGMECFQIHIHRDEGVSCEKLNYHAHMLFSWQDISTGKTLKLHKHHMSQIQTLVAETLDMERGELKENSNRERLEAIEYKRKQEEIRLELLQQQNVALEQKKNGVRERIEKLREDRKEAHRRTIFEKATNASTSIEEFTQWSENDLNYAIIELESEISKAERLAQASKQAKKRP